MLQTQHTIENNEIYTLKLSTGEEIIAKIDSYSKDYVTVSKPLVLTVRHTHSGDIQAMFVPYCLTFDPDVTKTVDINRMHIIGLFKTPHKFAMQYTSQSSGVALSSA